MKALVTGAAGFIGSRIFHTLASRGDEVVGIDNINDYYDTRLKYGRLAECGIGHQAEIAGQEVHSTVFGTARFIRMSIDDNDAINRLFMKEKFDIVVNLAAQAGVRYSITNPYAYLQSNLAGFLNILECCRNHPVKHLVYASSSSVYGMNESVPYREEDKADSPVSLYAATKKSNELMAHAYSKLYGIPVTGLRFFTVYGPWGRPDMSPMLFADAISHGRSIKVFNNGDMIRDFTYIDDIVEGTIKAMEHIPSPDHNGVQYRIYNIGCSHPVRLMDFIEEIETAMGKKAGKIFLPMQPGDVYRTNADTSLLEKEVGYRPCITLHEGISRFIEWYCSDSNPLR
ncbi:MAG: NAD-dependent epimerase [Bacteroidales bacterium]|nr:NAD-dependent epimerase [Bacteroides sp.]MCM1197641.1 NAD-dependent epimerase [Clostridium sp.]MCM1501208.1 NAD-dependent epimerase [Bacteroidales bacterium]